MNTAQKERKSAGSCDGVKASAWAEAQVRLMDRAVNDRVAERTAELHAWYDREHRLAEMLQRALLLSPPRVSFPDLRVEGISEAAFPEALLGGDFFDVVPLDGANVALVLGDVCGKGLVAALHVPEIKFALRAFLSESASPARALARLNDRLCAAHGGSGGLSGTPVALSLVVLDRASGAGACCVAGADAPLILRAHGPCGVLPVAGMILGGRPGEAYQESLFRLAPGDALLLVTDGITEARRGNEFLGYDGVAGLAARAWAAPAPEGGRPRAVAQALFLGAHGLAEGPLHDDASVLVAERPPR